jgi:hypothetical protein
MSYYYDLRSSARSESVYAAVLARHRACVSIVGVGIIDANDEQKYADARKAFLEKQKEEEKQEEEEPETKKQKLVHDTFVEDMSKEAKEG